MKFLKSFRILAIALTLATIGAVIPAVPVLAATIAITPNSGPAGTEVFVTAGDFTGGSPTSTVYVRLDEYTTSGTLLETTTIGEITTEGVIVTIPEGTSGGEHLIWVVRSGASADRASESFWVLPRLSSINPDNGKVGDTINVEGDGFVSEAPSVYFYWDEVRITSGIQSSSPIVNADGELNNVRIAAPPSLRGEHELVAEDRKNENSRTDPMTFTVESKLTVSPASGGVGDTLTLTGTGFGGGAVSIFFDQQVLTTANVPTTGSNAGSFTQTITVPPTSAGSHTIKAVDTEEVSVTFNLSQQITVTPTTPLFVGDSITVNGSGFALNQPVTVTLDNLPITITPTPFTTPSGTFTTTFAVPAASKGDHVLRVQAGSGAASQATITIKEKITALAPTNGPGGTAVRVSGTGFTPGSATVNFDDVSIGSISVEANGSFTNATFNVPANAASGPHTITIQGVTAPSFTVDPKLTLSPTSGVSGNTINVTGTGFGSQKTISFIIDNLYGLVVTPSPVVSDQSGNITASFCIASKLFYTF